MLNAPAENLRILASLMNPGNSPKGKAMMVLTASMPRMLPRPKTAM